MAITNVAPVQVNTRPTNIDAGVALPQNPNAAALQEQMRGQPPAARPAPIQTPGKLPPSMVPPWYRQLPQPPTMQGYGGTSPVMMREGTSASINRTQGLLPRMTQNPVMRPSTPSINRQLANHPMRNEPPPTSPMRPSDSLGGGTMMSSPLNPNNAPAPPRVLSPGITNVPTQVQPNAFATPLAGRDIAVPNVPRAPGTLPRQPGLLPRMVR